MIVCKVLEIVVLSLGITAILLGNVSLMFVVLFLLGGQAATFVTSKLGSDSRMVRTDKLASANGVINMASMGPLSRYLFPAACFTTTPARGGRTGGFQPRR